jgi:hypothetical protein
VARLAERYLEAVDRAWNEYQQSLKLEQWAAVRGLAPEVTARLRTYLEARGIL